MQKIRICHTHSADPNIPLPQFQTDGAAGADLRANLVKEQRKCGLEIAPGARKLVPLGLIMEIPPGLEGQIRPRSGMALKYGITVLNSPGTIDCDYRGEVSIILINYGEDSYVVFHGDRIAQLVVAQVSKVTFVHSKNVGNTEREGRGFGSTGLK